ncbi:MAG: hypothetical protein PHW15_01795 [Patescibacteria group bacterium]|jgi:hypothetical protein|nr:hypothetical protein [Patescibacteria group bacterium]MDD5172781.1 hypothetical protein [Patescibacteria group bacterium]
MENEQKNVKKEFKKILFVVALMLTILIVLFIFDSQTDFLLNLAELFIK